MPRELVYFSPTLSPRDYRREVSAIFSRELSRQGLRLTSQRRRILDELMKTDRHLSEEEIYRSLASSGIGRTTVFRTLKVLKECRLVEQVSGTDRPRFELRWERPHHDHLVCISCGHIQEVRWPKLEAIQERTCRKIGFAPKWHRHEIFGLCAVCSR